MKSLISEGLISSLCEQISHEKYNANLYLYFAAFLKNKGFDNLAKIFEHQHSEETEHSLLIYGFLTDMNAPVFIPEISEISMPIDDIRMIAETYLNREILTTESLDEIKHQAISEHNSVTEEFLRKMVALQQAEYSEATSFYDSANLTNGDWFNVMLWNLGIG